LTEKLETRKQKLENGMELGMEFGQSGGVGVDVGESEFEFVQ
jgi:hypothetical protein